MLSELIFGGPPTTELIFAELILAGLVVIVAGSRFTRRADDLAERLNLSGGWIGLVLVATVTSLPELVSSGTATALGNVDLAFGGILGSCCFNITIIVLLNGLVRGGSVLRGVSAAHALTSSFGLVLIAVALLGFVVLEKFAGSPRILSLCELVWVTIIFVTYLGCVRLAYRFEHRAEPKALPRPTIPPGTKGYGAIAFLAVIIVAASWWLAGLADVLSTHEIEAIGRPLGATFVGAFFLAIGTSLPEITTSIAAVRLGNLDLALGNIFGSNMFNIFVIPFLKGVSLFQGESLMVQGNQAPNIMTGLLAMLLTGIAVGGLTYQSSRKTLRWFGFDSVLIAVVYIGGMILLMAGG